MTFRCYPSIMTQTARRSTIYFDPELHRALRIKAAETDRSVSDLVNDAVKLVLSEDAEDLAAFEERAGEPNLSFEAVVAALKADGKI
jgi:plasmid stability protein